MLRNIAVQAIVFFLIFNGLSWLRETGMLATQTKVSPQYPLATLLEEPITLQSNGKKTLIYFFAPWCSVCHISIENVQSIYASTPTIDVIGVALDYDDVDEVREFTNMHQLTFPIALGDESVKKTFKIKGYPSYYVLDEENTIVSKSMGYSSEIGMYIRSL
ncbi:TlpA family protein disulfide reductase [Colwelliaceae bacterium 6471]